MLVASRPMQQHACVSQGRICSGNSDLETDSMATSPRDVNVVGDNPCTVDAVKEVTQQAEITVD